MEALVNFLVPKDEAVDLDYMKTYPIVNERDENRNLTVNFGGRPYENAVVAYATQGVVAALIDEDTEIDTIKVNIELIINPPEGLDLTDYAFDVDEHADQEALERFTPNFTNYVHKDNYQTSCPHRGDHDHRFIHNGVISCYFDTVSTYSKLIDWHRSHKYRLPSKDVQRLTIFKDYDQQVPLNDDQIRLIGKVLNRKGEFFKTIFQVYCIGVNNELHLDTLSRNRLQFNYINGTWTSIDQNPLKTPEIIMKRLKALRSFIYKPEEETFHVLFSLVADYDDIVNIDKYQILIALLSNYYHEVTSYTQKVYDVATLTWLKIEDNYYTLPYVHGKVVTNITYEDITPKFFDIISKLNNLNKIN